MTALVPSDPLLQQPDVTDGLGGNPPKVYGQQANRRENALSDKHCRGDPELKQRAPGAAQGSFSQPFMSYSFKQLDRESRTLHSEWAAESVRLMCIHQSREKTEQAPEVAQGQMLLHHRWTMNECLMLFRVLDPISADIHPQCSAAVGLLHCVTFLARPQLCVNTVWMRSSTRASGCMRAFDCENDPLHPPVSLWVHRDGRGFPMLQVPSSEEEVKDL